MEKAKVYRTYVVGMTITQKSQRKEKRPPAMVDSERRINGHDGQADVRDWTIWTCVSLSVTHCLLAKFLRIDMRMYVQCR